MTIETAEVAATHSRFLSLASSLKIPNEMLALHGLLTAQEGPLWATYVSYAEACLEAISSDKGRVVLHPLTELSGSLTSLALEMIPHIEPPIKLESLIGIKPREFGWKVTGRLEPQSTYPALFTPHEAFDRCTGRRLVIETDRTRLQLCPMCSLGRYRLAEAEYVRTAGCQTLRRVSWYLCIDTQLDASSEDRYRVDQIEITNPGVSTTITFKAAHRAIETDGQELKKSLPFEHQGWSYTFTVQPSLVEEFSFNVTLKSLAPGILKQVGVCLPREILPTRALTLPQYLIGDTRSRLLDQREEQYVTDWIRYLFALASPLDVMTGLIK